MSLVRVKGHENKKLFGEEGQALDDEKIIDLYLSRDESAIRETQEKYGARLRQTAYRILENHGAAEECENDTYLEAWNRIPPHEPRGYFFEFLVRIIKHAAIDACRRNNRLKRRANFCELTKEMEECLPGEEGADRNIETQELNEIITDFLKHYPEEPRGIFLRRYWFFDTVPEISRRFGCTQGKVKSTLFRMREALKKRLEREGYTP